jgi:hypothetical protein
MLKQPSASHLVAGNVNLALVRQALGHRSINSTMQYVGTSDGQAAEAAQPALGCNIVLVQQNRCSVAFDESGLPRINNLHVVAGPSWAERS